MAKAARVPAALKRYGWMEMRRSGTHQCSSRAISSAECESLSAIAFALEGDPRDYDADAEAVTLDVSVAPAA
jgi:hypothetical protein